MMLLAALPSCRKEGQPSPSETVPPPSAPKVEAKPWYGGADLELTWRPVEYAEEYVVYGDGSPLIRTEDTAVILNGGDGVYAEIEVCAQNDVGRACSTLNLTPWEGSVSDIVSHDLTGNSWVRIDFTTPSINALQQDDVDPNVINTGYFLLYNNYGYAEIRDAGATPVGQARMEMAFSDNMSGFLAPGPGNYNTVQNVVSGGFYFFWADNTSAGYGSMDENDYFGAIRVDDLNRSGGGYVANFTIYIQHNVPGLRWIKF